jgi:hypothetical protein
VTATALMPTGAISAATATSATAFDALLTRPKRHFPYASCMLRTLRFG